MKTHKPASVATSLKKTLRDVRSELSSPNPDRDWMIEEICRALNKTKAVKRRSAPRKGNSMTIQLRSIVDS